MYRQNMEIHQSYETEITLTLQIIVLFGHLYQQNAFFIFKYNIRFNGVTPDNNGLYTLQNRFEPIFQFIIYSMIFNFIFL